MFSNLPNVNIRIIPNLLYKTIRSNIPISGNFYELVESGIISNSDYIFLAKTSFLNLKDTSSLLGYYNYKLFSEVGLSTYSVDIDHDVSANQYAHAMCPYVSTSELADKSDLNFVLVATDWVKLFCLFQPFVVYQGKVYGYKNEPVPVLDVIKESFCKIFEVVPMEARIKSELFRGFAQRYCT
jgi:hypothetical protein